MTKGLMAELMADRINGREYPFDLTKEEQEVCKANRLVVVAGASDDLMEFYGFIRDEMGAPGEAYITQRGLIEEHFECECRYCGFEALKSPARTITAKWCPNPDVSWVIESEIPHANFTIMEDGEKFCEGIVFSMDEVE